MIENLKGVIHEDFIRVMIKTLRV